MSPVTLRRRLMRLNTKFARVKFRSGWSREGVLTYLGGTDCWTIGVGVTEGQPFFSLLRSRLLPRQTKGNRSVNSAKRAAGFLNEGHPAAPLVVNEPTFCINRPRISNLEFLRIQGPVAAPASAPSRCLRPKKRPHLLALPLIGI
jgi:hypothetical protein